MRKIRKGSFTKVFHIFIILLLCSLLTACSLKYINIFSLKPSSPDIPPDNTSDTDTISQEDQDESGQTPDTIEEIGDPEDNPPASVGSQDQDDIAPHDNMDVHKDRDNDNDEDPAKEPGGVLDKDSNPPFNGDMNDAGSNPVAPVYIDKDGNPRVPNEDAEPQDDESAESDNLDAVPAARIIRKSSNTELKQVALTFDDGPDDYFTPKVLDILKEYDVKATFFVVGSFANKYRDVLERIDDEGHVIASHGWSHKNFTKISKKRAIEELTRTNDLIEEVTGKTNTLFRLPYGAYNKKVLRIVADQGFHNIYWSIDPRDWSGIPPREILADVKKNLKPGSIILLHSFGSHKSIPNTIKALPEIIEYIQGQGYELVTIPELLKDTLSQEN